MTAPAQSVFRALADSTRRDILLMLSERDMTIAQLAGNFDMTRAAVRKHLTMLSDGGLITITPRGREKVSRLRPEAFRPVRDWLTHFDRFWDDRLTALKSAVEKDRSE